MSAKKIGILTYHSVTNFGANLQVYSSVGYLRENGYDPLVINWIPVELEQNYGKGNPPEQIRAHQEFVSKLLPLTSICRTSEDVAKVIREEGIEGVLIGSDVVLQHKTLRSRTKITRRGIRIAQKRPNITFPNPFWGGFLPYLDKKIPVSLLSAASQNMPYRQIRGSLKRRIGEAIRRFEHVNVRDEFTSSMIAYFTGGEVAAPITPDPVFAFNSNIPEQLSKEEIMKRFSLPENYVLLSFKNRSTVSADWISKTASLLSENGLSSFVLTMPGGQVVSSGDLPSIDPPLSPMEWYALIRYSQGYIGENMHPIVVALHNAVPFYAFDDYGTATNEAGSKIYSILKKAGFSEYRKGTLLPSYEPPQPEELAGQLLAFDRNKCAAFSRSQEEEFHKMMKEMLSA